MKRCINKLLFFALVCLCFSCKPKGVSQNLQAPTTNVDVYFLDSLAASTAILVDDSYEIFSRLTKLDMCIQMKGACKERASKAEVLLQYKEYLQEDVTDFTTEEMEWLGGIWKEAVELCNKLNKNILPPNIQLIKSKGSYYGNDAFYTRENCIVIPSARIQMRQTEAMLSVMLHEIFHIYSRINPTKQKALYALIGFESIGDSRNLIIDSPLSEQILSNPDGPNFAYAIDLKTSKGIHKCVPIISSTLPAYVEEKGEFFDYLSFNLFAIEQTSNGRWKVLSNAAGEPILPDDALPSFFDQIKDNTQYIIHPDEVLADNFMILALSKKDTTQYENLSSEGKILLKKIEAIL